MKKLFLALFLTTSLASCAPQVARIKDSPYPEAVFPKQSVATVRNKLIAACDKAHLAILETTDNAVVCQKDLEGGDKMIATLIIGNRYSTDPVEKIRFTVYSTPAGAKASARAWIETQMAFGQVRQTEMNSNKNYFNEVQNMFYRIGGK